MCAGEMSENVWGVFNALFLSLCTALLQMDEYCEKVNRWGLNRQIFIFYCINYLPCRKGLGLVRTVRRVWDVSLLYPCNLSNWDSFVTRQVYKHTCQNVSEKKSLSLHCCKIKSNLFVCLLWICQVFSVSCKIVLVTTNCCFMRSDIMLHSSFLSWAIVDWTSEVQHGRWIMLWSQSSSN